MVDLGIWPQDSSFLVGPGESSFAKMILGDRLGEGALRRCDFFFLKKGKGRGQG